jgi:ring-1,2-phenylacetyl-CoA epoxidase subunit PaaD
MLADKIFALLAQVPDPEIPVISLTELGIIREVRMGAATEVVITPTYSGCPASLVIERSVRAALDGAGFADVGIRTELSPAWTTDWISAPGREKLRAYGIAPPETAEGRLKRLDEAPAACPQCGSGDTREISRFGSTPCKALWRCLNCAEPFDRFKCL